MKKNMSLSSLFQRELIFYISTVLISQNRVQPAVQDNIVHPFGVQLREAIVLVAVYVVVDDVVVTQ